MTPMEAAQEELKKLTSLNELRCPSEGFEGGGCGGETPDQSKLNLGALQALGWPLRQLLVVNKMHGPSLEKAKELLPKTFYGSLIILLGERGPGKTQMATWIAYQRHLDQKPVGRYYKAMDLFGALKATWGEKGGNEEQRELMDRFKSTPFLVVDELSEALVNDWERRLFVNIIDHRYDAMKPTILIANLSEKEAEQSLGRSIWSRAQETGGVVLCDWSSYRTP